MVTKKAVFHYSKVAMIKGLEEVTNTPTIGILSTSKISPSWFDVTKSKRRYVEEISNVEPIDIQKSEYIKYKKNGNGYNSKVTTSKDCYLKLIFK